MSPQNHSLEIYEPYDYQGPNPLSTRGVGLLAGPAGNRYYLVAINNDLQLDEQPVKQLLIQCRYSEDQIERPTISTCTVNIARVRPGLDLDLDTPFTFSDIIPWGVGRITPVNSQ